MKNTWWAEAKKCISKSLLISKNQKLKLRPIKWLEHQSLRHEKQSDQKLYLFLSGPLSSSVERPVPTAFLIREVKRVWESWKRYWFPSLHSQLSAKLPCFWALKPLQTVCAFFFSHCNLRRNLEKKKLFLFKKKSRELLCSSRRSSSSSLTRFRKQLKQVESYCMQASFKPPSIPSDSWLRLLFKPSQL